MGLFDAIQQIANTAKTPAEGDPNDPMSYDHSRYHYWIVIVGCFFTVVGVILGLVTSVIVANSAKTAKVRKGIVLAPVLFGAGGFVFGMAIMCLMAPRSFLTGPIGKPWMKLIGTSSVAVARFTCLLIGLLVMLPLIGLGILIVQGKITE
jgi:hypothetical protein